MKDLMSLWRELATEVASWCGTSAVRDCKTVTDRTEAEGESFLRITLPQFCKDFERGLELGLIDNTLFHSFVKRRGLPEFLQGFLCQIFSADGALLDEPSVDCIFAVRQLTLVFGKIESECTKVRTSRAMRRYVEIEQELREIDSSSFEEFLPQFRKASTLLWADLFSDVENHVTERTGLARDWVSYPSHDRVLRIEDPFLGLLGVKAFQGSDNRSCANGVRNGIGDDVLKWQFPVIQESLSQCEIVNPSRGFLTPRHGPGATADGLTGNGKFDQIEWPQRLERIFPYGKYAVPYSGQDDQFDHVQFLEPGKERPVKVIPVPKTLKTPRIIAKEPTAMQYMQQALAQQFIQRLEDVSPSRHEVPTGYGLSQKDSMLGRYFIGFKHQEPNRLLARKGSESCDLATLDLSDASDRVLNQHVELLMSRFPRLSEAVQATRSTKADVPDHGIIPLVKFASMGSALCFPVEAMVFVTIVFTAIAHQRKVPLTRGLIMSLRSQVRVYGDDIVVPVEYVHTVIQLLEAFGLRVNMDKSFWNGKFRESCGGDYYDGVSVTPIRLRHELPRSLTDVSSVVGLVAFRNLLYWNGFWMTASRIDKRLHRLFRGQYPVVDVSAAALGRESVFGPQLHIWRTDSTRLHPHSHVPLARGPIVRHRIPSSTCSGEGALLKYFLKQGILPSQDGKHLERQGRPEAVRIKLRWVRPF